MYAVDSAIDFETLVSWLLSDHWNWPLLGRGDHKSSELQSPVFWLVSSCGGELPVADAVTVAVAKVTRDSLMITVYLG